MNIVEKIREDKLSELRSLVKDGEKKYVYTHLDYRMGCIIPSFDDREIFAIRNHEGRIMFELSNFFEDYWIPSDIVSTRTLCKVVKILKYAPRQA